MFGFLKPRAGLCCHVRSALNQHLCAACHGMASFGGRPLALLANYDATFWVVVASALCGAPAQAAPRPCTALPFRRVAVAAAPPRALAVMAAMNLLLLAAKVRDDVSDGEGFGRRAAGWALGPWTRRARRFLAREGFPVQAVVRAAARARTPAKPAVAAGTWGTVANRAARTTPVSGGGTPGAASPPSRTEGLQARSMTLVISAPGRRHVPSGHGIRWGRMAHVRREFRDFS